ncbi:MAG TPA: tetratricopeptide repeat protein [Stenomitos sp.]
MAKKRRSKLVQPTRTTKGSNYHIHPLLLGSPITAFPSEKNIFYAVGNVLFGLYKYSHDPSDFMQALLSYELALSSAFFELALDRQRWKAFPVTQTVLGSHLVRDGQWQEGLRLLENSLRQLSQEGDPLVYANALFQTARAHEILSDWEKARLYYRDALRLYEHLKYLLGVTQSRAGLGSVLVSEGHLKKGIAELQKAYEGYCSLQQSTKADEVNNICQAAQRALEKQPAEVYT